MTSIDTCDTCFYYFGYPNGLGECTCDKFRLGYRIPRKDVKEDEVLVEDDEGWAFLVGPKFGCIHWTALDKPA